MTYLITPHTMAVSHAERLARFAAESVQAVRRLGVANLKCKPMIFVLNCVLGFCRQNNYQPSNF